MLENDKKIKEDLNDLIQNINFVKGPRLNFIKEQSVIVDLRVYKKMSKFDLKLELMRDSEVEIIKDFLKIKGFRRTLECLIKEERYKNIENRNLKVSFINYFI